MAAPVFPSVTASQTISTQPSIARSEQTVTISSIPYYTLLETPRPTSTSIAGLPLAVLIPALMSNHRIFDPTVPVLHALGYRILRYDHIGHNRTLPPQDPTLNQPGQFTFDSFCEHLHRIIQTVAGPDVHPAAIIGCSIGGVLALRYHMLYPPSSGQMVKVLSMAAPGMKTLPDAPEKWATRVQKWKDDGGVHDLATKTLERWFPEPVPGDFDWWNARSIVESCSLDGYEICAWATCHFDFISNGELEALAERERDARMGEREGRAGENIMILAGENDTNIGPKKILEDACRRVAGKYLLMEGVGHIPPLHWPERFNEVVREFLRRAEE